MEMTIDGRSFSIEETASNQLVAKVTTGLGGPLTSCFFLLLHGQGNQDWWSEFIEEELVICHYILWAIFY